MGLSVCRQAKTLVNATSVAAMATANATANAKGRKPCEPGSCASARQSG